MPSRKLAPFIWFRLLAILIFIGLVAVQEMWILVVVGVALAALTVAQLIAAYRNGS